MKNTMTDVQNILMAELERLNDETLTTESMDMEIKRSQAITKVAQSVINNGNLALNTAKFIDEQMSDSPLLPSYMVNDHKRMGA